MTASMPCPPPSGVPPVWCDDCFVSYVVVCVPSVLACLLGACVWARCKRMTLATERTFETTTT